MHIVTLVEGNVPCKPPCRILQVFFLAATHPCPSPSIYPSDSPLFIELEEVPQCLGITTVPLAIWRPVLHCPKLATFRPIPNEEGWQIAPFQNLPGSHFVPIWSHSPLSGMWVGMQKPFLSVKSSWTFLSHGISRSRPEALNSPRGHCRSTRTTCWLCQPSLASVWAEAFSCSLSSSSSLLISENPEMLTALSNVSSCRWTTWSPVWH